MNVVRLHRRRCRRHSFPFRKRSMPFLRHLEIFLTVNEFFKEKGKFASNHLVSNPEPLSPNIPLIPAYTTTLPG